GCGEQHRGALPAGGGKVRSLDREVRAVVVDRADPGRIGEHVVLAVGDDRVVVPGALPQLVQDVEVFVGDLVPVVVLDLVGQPVVARGVGQVRGDDVPADPALREVVER